MQQNTALMQRTAVQLKAAALVATAAAPNKLLSNMNLCNNNVTAV
jgi:hypothetical protein